MRHRLLALLGTAVAVVGCGRTQESDPSAVRADGIEHVHGLGVNPKDGALMVASHSGLFRLGPKDRAPQRVGDLRQDTMGFTVVGPDRFLGSGHPDARTGDPPHLGLIASDDGGRSWRSRSLRGDADLHALAAHSHVIYAYDSISGALIASADRGRTWVQRRAPGAVASIALDPAVETRLAASTQDGVFLTSDGGATWRRLAGVEPGLLSWPRRDALVHMALGGAVRVSVNAGRSWRRRGELQAEPVAMTAEGEDLFAADGEGRIFASGDGGQTWRVRTEP